jgi:hypothetical protein
MNYLENVQNFVSATGSSVAAAIHNPSITHVMSGNTDLSANVNVKQPHCETVAYDHFISPEGET